MMSACESIDRYTHCAGDLVAQSSVKDLRARRIENARATPRRDARSSPPWA
jgi:hypothetical protein